MGSSPTDDTCGRAGNFTSPYAWPASPDRGRFLELAGVRDRQFQQVMLAEWMRGGGLKIHWAQVRVGLKATNGICGRAANFTAPYARPASPDRGWFLELAGVRDRQFQQVIFPEWLRGWT